MATRAKKITGPKPTKKAKTQTSGLCRALDFVAFAQRDIGLVFHRHCVLYGGWVYAFDGILAAGHKIEEDMQAVPHTGTLRKALERVGATLALVQSDSSLLVQGEKLRSVVPCLQLRDMPPFGPDPACGPCDDRLRQALSSVMPLVADNAEYIFMACILIADQTATAAHPDMMVQAWHGISLPRLLVPKVFAKELAKIAKPIVSFGFSSSSFTLHFDDESWIRTNLYSDEKYPDIERAPWATYKPWAAPTGLFEAIDTVKAFVGDSRRVYLSSSHIRSEVNEAEGTTFAFEGLPDGLAFNVDQMLLVKAEAEQIDWPDPATNRPLMFHGPRMRGIIAQYRTDKTPA